MYNPIRRNKNIGTSKQGYKINNNNKLSIPIRYDLKMFFEKIDKCITVNRTINGHDFLFIVEKTKKDYKHACSIDDIQNIIEHIPKEDYGILKLIVLRQPKKKEEIISPVWGRWVPFFGKEREPAIILEALNYKNNVLKWSKKLSPEGQKEIDRLITDGHKIINDGRNYLIHYDLNSVRNTQLFRTIPHEFGHHVHYFNFIDSKGSDDQWYSVPKFEKEKFAHSYAEKITINM